MAKKKKVEVVADSDLDRLVDWVTDSEDSTNESRKTSEKCRDYYDSKQLSAEEVATLKKRKQAPVVVNRCKPKMDALMGMEKAAKTTAKALPRTPQHEKAAEAGTESIRFVLQDNDFPQTRSATWENILIEGTGGCEIIARSGGEGGEGDVKIAIIPIPWDRLIYDPHCMTKDFSPRTCRYLGQVVWMDYDEAADLYPDGKDILETMQSGTQTYEDKPRWMDTKRRRVKIVELYYRDKGEVYYACFTRGGFLKGPQISPYKNEEGETEWPYEFATAFVDREGGRYGAMLQLLDVQDEINKRRSKALHLMSVRQVRWERGAVEDINKARQELAKPDGVLETTPGMEFEVLKTGDMAQAQFNLLTEAKNEIDLVGANDAIQGKGNAGQSGVALERRQQAGQTEIGPMFDVLRYWQYRVFKKVWNRVRQYWKAEKWIRVTDDSNNLRWVGLNKPVTKGEQMLEQLKARIAQLPPEQQEQAQQHLAQMEQQIQADPMMQEVIDTHNDIATLDVDIILTEVPDVLNAQIEDFQVLGEMVKSGFPMPPEAVIEASPLSNKDKILKMMKEHAQQAIPPQVQKQMEQMKEEGEKLQQENQQLKTGAQSDMMKMQHQAQSKMAELELQSQVQAKELEMQREKAAAEIQLKREMAQADYEIEQRKLEQAREAESAKLVHQKQCEDQKLAMTHEHEGRKLEFEREKHATESAMKPAETQKDPQNDKLAEAIAKLAKMMETMAQDKLITVKRQKDGSLQGSVTLQ